MFRIVRRASLCVRVLLIGLFLVEVRWSGRGSALYGHAEVGLLFNDCLLVWVSAYWWHLTYPNNSVCFPIAFVFNIRNKIEEELCIFIYCVLELCNPVFNPLAIYFWHFITRYRLNHVFITFINHLEFINSLIYAFFSSSSNAFFPLEPFTFVIGCILISILFC